MKRDYGDMYQYILESKKAVRNIISNHEEIFHDATFLMATMNKFM